jgi:hypothetical protein
VLQECLLVAGSQGRELLLMQGSGVAGTRVGHNDALVTPDMYHISRPEEVSLPVKVAWASKTGRL